MENKKGIIIFIVIILLIASCVSVIIPWMMPKKKTMPVASEVHQIKLAETPVVITVQAPAPIQKAEGFRGGFEHMTVGGSEGQPIAMEEHRPSVVSISSQFGSPVGSPVTSTGGSIPLMQGQGQQENVPVNKNQPFVDPRSGALLDGPGFEKGPTDSGLQQETLSAIPSNYYFLDVGGNGEMNVANNLCSKSCCSAQWGGPVMKNDPFVCSNKDDFVPSNIMCNNVFNDSGCMCVTKEQSQFIYNRGGNGREWF
jgi:hypothetical protein